MKKIILILLFLSSCVTIPQKCGSFVLNIENSNFNDLLFLTKFSKNLQKRLDLVANSKINNSCKIDVNFNKIEYSTITDESGYTGRKNFKIIVDYVLNIPNSGTVEDDIIFFYGANISDNYYSEYVSNKKRNNNDVDILSEKVFYSILNNLK